MKKMFAIFAGFVFATLCQLALAAPAVVSALTGTAQAIPGAGTPRALRIGDDVNQGETVATGENSSLVLRFEDGQVVALTSRSRMAVNAYTYSRTEPARNNVLLSLLNGGMRAITGLIGRRDPLKVAYRAGNATVGIRGTDVTIATLGGDVAVTVADGEITFTFNGQTVSISVGEGAFTLPNGQIQVASAAQIIAAVTAQNPALGALLLSVNAITLEGAVEDALRQSRTPLPPPCWTSGTPPPPGTTSGPCPGGGSSSTR
jgi:ferric-dicitrate binding protein FerR (iron transport regulator)